MKQIEFLLDFLLNCRLWQPISANVIHKMRQVIIIQIKDFLETRTDRLEIMNI